MSQFNVYTKSAKGREEVATRRYRLPQTRRVALILVDGMRPMTELFQQVQRLGLTEDVYAELASEGYIVPIDQHVDLDLTSPPTTGIDENINVDRAVDRGEAPPTVDLKQRYFIARTFMIEAIRRAVPDGASGFISNVELSIDLDDLNRVAGEFERLMRGHLDAESAAWTTAKLRSLLSR